MLHAAELPDTAVLSPWLASLGYVVRATVSLAGDVSPRRYFRLHLDDGKTAILAYYPSKVRDACARFLTTTELLQTLSIPVPEILGADCDAGFMLLQDLGTSTLYDRRDESWTTLVPYFEESVSILRRIRTLPVDTVLSLNPDLDHDLLIAELLQTWKLYLTPRQLTGDTKLAKALWQALEDICTRLAADCQVVCHRDFMARNLVPLGTAPGLGVLDHQDLRVGPAFYDLASLLNDSLFPPPEIEEPLVASFVSSESELLAYHRAAVQRTLKAVGTFEAFNRRGNPSRLHLIPPTLERALFHLHKVPEGHRIAGYLEELWQPVLGG
jgi:aminoglycoside/choline kinase family phosphotransferase